MKRYLGAGVHVECEGYDVVLTTENGSRRAIPQVIGPR